MACFPDGPRDHHGLLSCHNLTLAKMLVLVRPRCDLLKETILKRMKSPSGSPILVECLAGPFVDGTLAVQGSPLGGILAAG